MNVYDFRKRENAVDEIFIPLVAARHVSRGAGWGDPQDALEAARWAPSSNNSQPWRLFTPGARHHTGKDFSIFWMREIKTGRKTRRC